MRGFAFALLLAAWGAGVGCGSCGKGSDASLVEASAAVVLPEPPVPAPERLIGEAALTSPDAFWKRVQTGIGGAAAILPNSFAGVACALAGLDPSVARGVDGGAAAFAVMAEGDGGALSFALAMKLTDARRTQTLLIDAETAAFTAKETNGIRVLASKVLPLALAVGVARAGWLLVASSDADLARLAPYAYRTLPHSPSAAAGTAQMTIDVPRAALGGTLRARGAAAWGGAKGWLLQRDADERAKHGGRAPDFGDAPAIVACVDTLVERRLALVGDLDGVRVEIDASDDDVHAVATLKPSDGGGPASQRFEAMRPGAAAPLLDAPLDATIAWVVRDDAAERTSDAREIEQCVERALGKRLGDDDVKRLRAFADDWSKSRGDWLLASAMWGTWRGLAARGPSSDAVLSAKVLRDAAGLLQRSAFAEPLKRSLHVRDIAFGTSDAPPLGKVDVATLVRDEPQPDKAHPKVPSPAPLGMAWLARGGEVEIAIGESPAALLAATAKPKAKLGDDARIARAIGAFETNVTFAFVAQPAARTADRAGPPVVAAWGRRGHDGWLRVELGYGAARELIRSFVGP